MLPDDATVTYKWTINGKGAVTTETYEVPADANSGDAIKVVVTDEEGNTAEDVVYVGGFTILKVEPTTAQAQDDETGYKYIRAYFSSGLKSLAPEDIVLRDKYSEQLYSIDTVKLSSDGTYADITLFGSVSEGGTKFLQGGEIYVMTITNAEISDTYEFELPIFRSNQLVTNVDIANNKITLFNWLTLEVGDVYEENLGTLVGRTVNIGYNSDREVEKMTVNNADVVYGVMEFTEDGDDYVSAKDYFKDVVTNTKYYLSPQNTSKIRYTSIINVVEGDDIAEYNAGNDKFNVAALDGIKYSYAKLVLNPNGTVACAVLDQDRWDGTVKVDEIDGTIVSETSKVNVDLDGFTIEKDGKYITPEELEVGDLVFYEAQGDPDATKFAEVYNDIVTGTPGAVNSEKIAIDSKSYKWSYEDLDEVATRAKYYNKDDDVYEDLYALSDGTPEEQNVAAQKYLTNLDATKGVTAYLDRLGNIAYIDGTPSDEAVTTDTWYVTTSAGAGYTQALGSYLKFKVSDGTEKTIEIPVSQIKKFQGIAGTMTGEAGADLDKGTDYKFSFDPKSDDDEAPFGDDTEAQNLIESGVLVKLTEDESGKIIAIEFGGTYDEAGADTYEKIVTIDGKASNALKPGASAVVTNGAFKVKLTDKTNIWVYTTDLTDDGKVKVTKETFADYTRKTDKISVLNAVQGAPFDPEDPEVPEIIVGPYVLIKNSAVTDVLLRETLAEDENGVKVSNTFVDGDTSATEGIVTGFTSKKNAAGDANYVDTVTILEIDGSETTYDAFKEGTLDEIVAKNVYVSLNLDKSTGDAAAITGLGWTRTTGVDTANSSATEIKTLDNYTVKIDSEAQVLKKTASGYTTIKLNQIAASTKDLKISWHDQYYNADDNEHYADFVVVEEVEDAQVVTDEALEDDAEAAEVLIGIAEAAYGELDETAATKTAYETAVALAEASILAYAGAGGEAETLDGYADFVAHANAYEAAKAEISAINIVKVEDANLDLVSDTEAGVQEALQTAVEAVDAYDGYNPTVSDVTLDGNNAKYYITLTKDGYSKKSAQLTTQYKNN